LQRTFTMESCVFCQIIEHKIPAAILYEDEWMVAIEDAHPLATVHLLVIPRKHIPSMNEITVEDEGLLVKLLLKARELAFQKGIGEKGYRLAINTGAEGGQSVFHLHVHLLGGNRIEPGLMVRGLK
jgi:histidine triad (HIT) family protein